MFFTILLGLTAIVIAASAAFFSVYGLVHIYTGAVIPIIIMGGALEAGKLIAASFLYRHWKELGYAIRAYLFGAIILLMTITSLGIFGYLTASYQQDSIPLKEIAQQIKSDNDEKTRLLARNDDINKEIANLKNNIVNGRIRLEAQRKPELDTNNARIEVLSKEIAELQSKELNTEAHVGPIIFVAKAMGRQPDEAVFWFTLLIMSVFDPLAVALTLATNISAKHGKEKKLPEKPLEKLEPKYSIEDLKKEHGLYTEKEVSEALVAAINEAADTNDEVEQDVPVENVVPEVTAEPQQHLPPPPPLVVTETVVVDKTKDVQDIVKNIVGDSMNAEAKRRALLAATRK